ncbi:MAG: nodulation protein NfeD [Firmicutes bacterium]|nr:nodulation protein NfeD [Bacillota bacterium]MCL5038266.1 nodulation protein NfeD [Bacillota bacterium]
MKVFIPLFLLICLLSFTFPNSNPISASGSSDDLTRTGDLVFVVPIEGTIDPGLAAFLTRAFREAEKARATYILLEISTLGGTLAAALDIRDLFLASPIPVLVYVTDRAWSAGSLIAIAAQKLIMAPGASIGAAEPRPAEEKIISAWRAELEATAEKRGRDPAIAGAMAGALQDIPGVVEKGHILSLTAGRAKELGFIDAVATDRGETLRTLGLGNVAVRVFTPSVADNLARYVTSPAIAPLLLTLGFVGLLVELFIPGWGIAGTVGLLSFLLYFGGHMLAGFAGWEALALFALGIILLAVEAFIPGFGIFGLSGIVAVFYSIYLASASSQQALQSISIALVISILTGFALAHYGRRRGWWRGLVLGAAETSRHGYVPQRYRPELMGKTGVVLTPLRPAGMAEINGERVDVVSDGEFIPKGAMVKVVKIEGTRALVKILEERD